MLESLLHQFKATQPIEWVAFSFAILQVVFAYLNRPINFLFGAISVCFYIYIFYSADLIAESILNVYYFVVSVSGLVLWNKKKVAESNISKATKLNWQITFGIILACFIAVIGIYLFREKTIDVAMNGSHYIDAVVTAFAFGGTYLLLKRNIETWLVLNISNLIAMPLQWSKGLYLTAVLTFILFSVACAAWFKWSKEMNNIRKEDQFSFEKE